MLRDPVCDSRNLGRAFLRKLVVTICRNGAINNAGARGAGSPIKAMMSEASLIAFLLASMQGRSVGGGGSQNDVRKILGFFCTPPPCPHESSC